MPSIAARTGPMKIAVVTEDSNTLRSMLRRIGFDLLVRRPVHPYALKLLLARALYRSVPVGAEIPPALFRAVAEVLALVLSRRRRPAGSGDRS